MIDSGEKPVGYNYEAIDGTIHSIYLWYEDENTFRLTCRGRSTVAPDVKCWTKAPVTCLNCIAREE